MSVPIWVNKKVIIGLVVLVMLFVLVLTGAIEPKALIEWAWSLVGA